MILALKIIIAVLSTFTAIGLLCAVGIARSRDPVRIGRRRPPAADPFFHPFGEMPGFKEQLARFAPRYPGVTATPPVAGSGGASSFPSGDAAAARASFYRRHRHAR
jgi:hypothetical protein